MTSLLERPEVEALRAFAASQIDADELLKRLAGKVTLVRNDVGNREVVTEPMPEGVVGVTDKEIRWVLERYLHGKLSGEALSTWAGLLLAVPAYDLLLDDRSDEILGLLQDLAMPLKAEYLDREGLKERVRSIWDAAARGEQEGVPKG